VIEDVQIVPLRTYQDDRGFLMEIIRVAGGDEPHALAHKFGQVYLVGDPVRGAVRAYHKHAELWDWFCIVHGSAKFVLKDDRPESATCGEMLTAVAGVRAPKLIVVPPGVYHGWMALEDDTLMISVASHTYRRDEPDEVRIPPDSFGDVWTVKGR
jgi:dTDP-4-dehydrorhamnose 3,5-epimerase